MSTIGLDHGRQTISVAADHLVDGGLGVAVPLLLDNSLELLLGLGIPLCHCLGDDRPHVLGDVQVGRVGRPVRGRDELDIVVAEPLLSSGGSVRGSRVLEEAPLLVVVKLLGGWHYVVFEEVDVDVGRERFVDDNEWRLAGRGDPSDDVDLNRLPDLSL